MCKKGLTEEPNTGGGSVLSSKRWKLCFLLCMAYAVLLLHRVNLSMAVVCFSRPPGDLRGQDKVLNKSCNTNETLQTGTSGSTQCFYGGGQESIEDVVANESIDSNGFYNKTDVFKSDTFTVDWDKSLISVLLSSYFYGSIMTQVPAGKMADAVGGKNIMFGAFVITAVCSLLAPVCIRTHVALAFLYRIIMGLAAGAVFPVGVAMIGAWAPPRERASMIAISGCGVSLGPAISYFSSGYLCAYGFDGGWPSIFYIHGIVAGLFATLWWFQAFNSPSEHPSISRKELSYILAARQDMHTIRNVKTPWRSMLLSKPMWASTVSHFCFNWGLYTVMINVPLFMEELLLFNITQNAFYSALPYIFFGMSNILWAKAAFIILKRRWLSVLTVRRLFTSISLCGSSLCLVIVGHVTIELRHYAVVLLCFTCALTAMCFSGFLANHAEYAGMHSGTAYGISNCVSVISAILAAIMAGVMTQNGSQWEWQTVFYLSAGICVFGAIVFCFLSSATLEPWAETRIERVVIASNDIDEMENLTTAASKQSA